MAGANVAYSPGQRVRHAEFGEGVVVSAERNGFVRAFFGVGERQVALPALQPLLTDAERLVSGVEGSSERLKQAWLSLEAQALPLMESATSLTSANIDLLPHQVVLTHRVATASPRRYLIADEVGLGKTIETALVLRELHGRGELQRALMVVPAGLVNNWHRELNEVFHLDFEVFGSSGDVTDRKSNAFAKHDRLIASIDTLKRPKRVRRLLDAPPWDLVVFDEAHHLTAYQSGRSVRKTENYKLSEALRDHCRDLLLLSATPHQGDHFRFWKLVQLLSPTLFKSAEDMVANRHRLNTFVFRRTKADACRPDGSALFARRAVHTESFVMNEAERAFYGQLRDYLQEGFALAKRQGNQGRALGFVMAIFQKIAASSFAAVRRTLRRRMLMLTVHEAIVKDQDLDIEGRDRLYAEARALLHQELGIADDAVGRGEVDRHLADLKLKTLKKLREDDLALASDSGAGEEAAAAGEEMAIMAVSLALPEERQRIAEVLRTFPEGRETKVGSLIRGLGALWQANPNEKIVIFATYLGTVDLIGREIDSAYPGQGVVVLRGGDHGAKLAAERRFRKPDGPRVLVCTAAGREGINLQFARVLFNFDLPWNPMDLEQRIGRIHRYGQAHTAQVYNLVLSDTIEGRIFLMLDEKLTEIAKTLGKLDEDGQVAEDLRTQILGQLAERVRYDQLYQAALSDPELKRTKVELEVALSHAKEARSVVWDLFQDLDGFNLDDYRPFSDVSAALERLVRFLRADLDARGHRLARIDDTVYEVRDDHDQLVVRFTTDRDQARARDDLALLGLDHPLVKEALERHASRPAEELGAAVVGAGHGAGVATWWNVETQGIGGERKSRLVTLAVNPDGTRYPQLERGADDLFLRDPVPPVFEVPHRLALLRDHVEPLLQRELRHRGMVPEDGGFHSRLVGWVETGSTLQSVGPSSDPPPGPEAEPATGESLPIEHEVADDAHYDSHLPLLKLDAIAASAPAGEFGRGAVTQHVEPEGWLRVDLGRCLNDHMFICRIRGSSMDNGISGLVDGGLAVFELWPRGTRQHKIVLVRGAFADPDTGSYAVKKYVADQRGADGRHQEIRLVSLNPDKEHYPDIFLQPEDDEDLVVLASLITALDPDVHVVRTLDESDGGGPTTPGHRTRRLGSDDGRRKAQDQLSNRSERFFAAPGGESDDESPDLSSWNSQLLCLEAAAGGVHLEVGPLHGLWRFVKRLVLDDATGRASQMLASNTRMRPVQTPVSPSTGPWRWGADGFEDDPDVDLTSLDIPALALDHPTVFRVGADGVGRLVASQRLARQQHYRLVVPPAVWSKAAPGIASLPLHDGWQIVECMLDEATATAWRPDLQKLGLDIGGTSPSLGFDVSSWPDEWRANRRGEPFACFAPGRKLLIRVDGISSLPDGPAQLFVETPDGARSIELPQTGPAFVEFSALEPGRYFCTLLHENTSVQPIHLPFMVDLLAAAPPAAGWTLDVGSATWRGRPNALTQVWRGDLAELETETLAMVAPPGWPVRVVWREIHDDYLTTLETTDSGALDFEALHAAIRDRRDHRQVGDLILDLGELGTAVLQHQRRRSAQVVEAALRELVESRGDTVGRRAGSYLQLIPMWFEPVCRCLGYDLEALEEDPEDPPPQHAAAARLLVTERGVDGIRRRCKRVLILVETLESKPSSEMFAWVDGQCLRCGVDSALITTGLDWAEHRRRSRLPLEVWNLGDVLDDRDEGLIAFLRDMAEGV